MQLKIKEGLQKKLPEHKDERGRRERIAMKALGGFVIIMLALTILSRLADAITIPKVTVVNPKGGRVEHDMEFEGVLEAKDEVDIEAEVGFNIKEIFVEAGEQVKKGDALLRLDLEELGEKIEALQVEIEKMKLQKKQMTLGADNESLEDLVGDAKRVVERLEEDKELTSQQEDVKIKRIEEDLKKAEAELIEAQKSYEDFKGRNLDDQIAKVTEQVEEAKKNVEKQKYEQEKALKRAQKTVDEAKEQLWLLAGSDVTHALQQLERAQMEYEMTQNDWKRNVKEAEEELKKVQTQLVKLEEGEVDEETLKAEKEKVNLAENNVNNKQIALEDAKYNKEQAIAQVERQIIDAQRKILEAEKETVKKSEHQEKEEAENNISQELLQLDINLKEKELSKLVEIKMTDGMVKAPVAGVIDKVHVQKGDKTSNAVLMTMVSDDMQYAFAVEASKEDADKLEVGDRVTITLQGEKMPVEEETVIDSISNVIGDQEGKKKIVVNLTEGTPGLSGKLVVRKESQKYPSLVPVEAMREDSKGKYVLVMREQVTTLGPQLVAERVQVTELDKNGKMVGVQGGLNLGDQVITEANKPIVAGDRVRLVEQ